VPEEGEMSFVKQALGRIQRDGLKNLMPYALGRFHTVRTIYSAQSRAMRGKKEQDLTKTIFPDVNVDSKALPPEKSERLLFQGRYF
jgi:hypothetical protein